MYQSSSHHLNITEYFFILLRKLLSFDPLKIMLEQSDTVYSTLI